MKKLLWLVTLILIGSCAGNDAQEPQAPSTNINIKVDDPGDGNIFQIAPSATVLSVPGTDWYDVLDLFDFDALLEEQFEEIRSITQLGSDVVEITLPETAMIRTVSLLEWAEVMIQCLDGQGFSAKHYMGGVQADLDADQIAVSFASGVCMLQYPVDPLQRSALPRVQAERLYMYETGKLSRCLRTYGAEVGVTNFPDPPPLQSWLDNHYEGIAGWDPFQPFSRMTDGDTLSDAYERCPVQPSDLYPEW